MGIGDEGCFWLRSLVEFQIGTKSWVLETIENGRLWVVGLRWALKKKFRKGDNLSIEPRICEFEIYKKNKNKIK